jgi:hypothetical protein
MTMRVNIKDQYVDKFEDLIATLPKDAIEIDTIDEHSISFNEAQLKVQNAINNISLNNGIELDEAFEKIASY